MTIRSVSIPLHEGSKHIYYFRVAAENKLGTGPWVSTKEVEEEDEPEIEPTVVEETVPRNGPDTVDTQDNVVDDDDYSADPADDEPNDVDDTETNIISNDHSDASIMVADGNRIADNTPSNDNDDSFKMDAAVASPDPVTDDADAIFQTYDVDGDGFLNESEYKVCWLVSFVCVPRSTTVQCKSMP